MSLIRNLVKDCGDNKRKKTPIDEKTDKRNETDIGTPLVTNALHITHKQVIKSAVDLQRLHLQKLMKDPSKPVIIPEFNKEKNLMQSIPTFVRNVMGSSAGAGSGEFHVYRHLRRKEYARQKMIQTKSHREQLDDQYQQKVHGNRMLAEEKTARNRAKRLKKKQRQKQIKNNKKNVNNSADAIGSGMTEVYNEHKDAIEDELQD